MSTIQCNWVNSLQKLTLLPPQSYIGKYTESILLVNNEYWAGSKWVDCCCDPTEWQREMLCPSPGQVAQSALRACQCFLMFWAPTGPSSHTSTVSTFLPPPHWGQPAPPPAIGSQITKANIPWKVNFPHFYATTFICFCYTEKPFVSFFFVRKFCPRK